MVGRFLWIITFLNISKRLFAKLLEKVVSIPIDSFLPFRLLLHLIVSNHNARKQGLLTRLAKAVINESVMQATVQPLETS